MHFHCIKGGHPFKKDFWKSKENPVLAELDKDQLAFLDATSEQIENLGVLFPTILDQAVSSGLIRC